MKNLKQIVVLVLLAFFSIGIASAQNVELSGSQTRGTGSNAKLECVGITITKAMTVKSVTGDNEGFWIVQDTKTIKTYYKLNDPSVIGLVLSPGKYYIYPNLKQNQQKATIVLTLK